VNENSLPQVIPAGDAALMAVFAEEIKPEINARVRALATALEDNAPPGIVESVVAFATLLVYYDPMLLSFEDARSIVLDLAARIDDVSEEQTRLVEIPTLFGGAYGPDIPWIAQYKGMSEEDVLKTFTDATYVVYMLGFAPGNPYLGGLPPQLAVPRLDSPRKVVPAGTVAIANQASIYSLNSPGGWRWLGRTPIKMFDPSRNPPCFLQAGDRVKFVPISEDEYFKLGGEKAE